MLLCNDKEKNIIKSVTKYYFWSDVFMCNDKIKMSLELLLETIFIVAYILGYLKMKKNTYFGTEKIVLVQYILFKGMILTGQWIEWAPTLTSTTHFFPLSFIDLYLKDYWNEIHAWSHIYKYICNSTIY